MGAVIQTWDMYLTLKKGDRNHLVGPEKGNLGKIFKILLGFPLHEEITYYSPTLESLYMDLSPPPNLYPKAS